MSEKIRVSELFLSVQGEGLRTGKLSVWVRLWGCNLQCDGFKQDCPTNPSTYELPYKTINLDSIKRIEDLPVFERGCDSSYSWSAKFKNLVPEYTVEEIVDKIEDLLPRRKDNIPLWYHPVTNNDIDLCFTGGEPMLQQDVIVSIVEEINNRRNKYPQIQIETNGTIPLTDDFIEFAIGQDICFNVSPKLYNVSGEKSEKAWKPEVIHDYFLYGTGCLKFVVNNSDESWEELEDKVVEFGSYIPVFLMFVGATKEQQNDPKEIKKFANRALKEGYHISGRLHANLWNNEPGT